MCRVGQWKNVWLSMHVGLFSLFRAPLMTQHVSQIMITVYVYVRTYYVHVSMHALSLKPYMCVVCTYLVHGHPYILSTTILSDTVIRA